MNLQANSKRDVQPNCFGEYSSVCSVESIDWANTGSANHVACSDGLSLRVYDNPIADKIDDRK